MRRKIENFYKGVNGDNILLLCVLIFLIIVILIN